MSKHIRAESFGLDELVKHDSSRDVVLASGSPIMTVVATEGDQCLCEWEDDAGGKQRHLFSACVLRRLVRFKPEDVPFATDDPLNAYPG